MNVLCTSFPLAPRRIARSRATRVLIWALAIVLTVANIAAAAMPPAPVSSASRPTQSHAQAAAHCADHDAVGGHRHRTGERNCACCFTGACACVQACDVPALAPVSAAAPPPVRIVATTTPRDYDARETPLLRPPIG